MGLRTWAARLDRRGALMHGMCDRLGIDLAGVARSGCGTVLRRAMQNCTACRASVECGAWLRSGGTRGDRHIFCPNADLFDGLRP